MNIMTTCVIPTTPSKRTSTSVPSEYQFTKMSHALRRPHPQRSRSIFNQKFNSASSTPVPLEAQFTRTTPVLQTTPSTYTSKPIPSEVKFKRTTPMLPTTPSSATSSPAPLYVQFTWMFPMLPTTPSTTVYRQSEVLAPESSSIRRFKASRKTPFMSLFLKKTPLKNPVRNSPLLQHIIHHRSASYGPNRITRKKKMVGIRF